METIGSFEAKTHFSDLLRRVALGEEFLVTLRGTPVARLVPTETEQKAAQIKEVRARLAEFRKKRSRRGPVLKKGETWKDLAHEGHKW